MRYFYKFLLWIMGWKLMDPPAPDPKCIILGVPHTSAWDFLISFLYYNSMGRTAYVMVKEEFFKGPFGPVLRAMGGIPVRQGKEGDSRYITTGGRKRDDPDGNGSLDVPYSR